MRQAIADKLLPPQGVNAVFCLTNYWEHLFAGSSPEEAGMKEATQAFNVALAASKTPTLEHYLFSTLPHATTLTQGKGPVPHMDHKAGVDDRIRKELPGLAAKTTFVWMGWYSSNMAFFPPIRPFELPLSGGKWIWMQPSRPDALLPISGDVSVNLGVFAVAALQHPEKTHGKYIDVRTDLLSFTDVLKVWSEVTGKSAEYVPIPPGTFSKLWGTVGVEMSMQYESGEMWGDWERLKGVDVVQPGDIGIERSQLVDLRGDLMKLKDRLLTA